MSAGWPWFPMYAADFTNSRRVRVMTPEQVGVYILLLCHEWDAGPLPDDMVELAALCNGADASTVRTVLERCFIIVDGRWLNARLESVRDTQEAKRMRKVMAGQASGKARQGRNLPDLNTVQAVLEHRSNNRESESDTESEQITPPSVESASEGGKKKRKAALPPDWKPNEGHHERAKAGGLIVELEAEAFRDHHTANGSVMLDWDAAFRTWLRNAVKFADRDRQRGRGAIEFRPPPDALDEAQRESLFARELAKRLDFPPPAKESPGPLAGSVARILEFAAPPTEKAG